MAFKHKCQQSHTNIESIFGLLEVNRSLVTVELGGNFKLPREWVEDTDSGFSMVHCLVIHNVVFAGLQIILGVDEPLLLYSSRNEMRKNFFW